MMGIHISPKVEKFLRRVYVVLLLFEILLIVASSAYFHQYCQVMEVLHPTYTFRWVPVLGCEVQLPHGQTDGYYWRDATIFSLYE